MTPLGLPVFSWPFNISAIAWLAAISLREGNTRPKRNELPEGSPEAIVYRAELFSRIEMKSLGLRLPFLGEWSVTQGFNGYPTHKNIWKHGFDFEVLDKDGFPFRREKTGSSKLELTDYFCFDAPVVAAEDGNVAVAEASIPDNEPGTTNTENNFGNHIVIRHNFGYSLYAHLKQFSLLVSPGMYVKRGDIIARCGSSGRAPRPHLHFHIQENAAIGSSTKPFCFDSYLLRNAPDSKEEYVESGLPLEFQRCAAIESAAGAFTGIELPAGEKWRFAVREGNKVKIETWLLEEDLWGGIKISLEGSDALASFSKGKRGWAGFAFEGKKNNCLYALFLGISHVPPKLLPCIEWSDRVSALFGGLAYMKVLKELAVPFFGHNPDVTSFRVSEQSSSKRIIIEATGKYFIVQSEWQEGKGLIALNIRNGREIRATRLNLE